MSKVHFVKDNKDGRPRGEYKWCIINPDTLVHPGLRIACDDWFCYNHLPSTTNIDKVTCNRCKRTKVYKKILLKTKYPLFQFIKD